MKKRLLSAAGMIIVGVPILIFSEYILFPIALGIIGAFCVWEMLRVLGLHKNMVVSIPSYALILSLPIFAYKWFFGTELINYIPIVLAAIFAYLLFLICVSVLSNGRIGSKDISLLFLMVAYMTLAMVSMSVLRYIRHGVFMFLLPLFGAWICDIFAYFTGRLFGRHKLAPYLSPKKTVEGAVGGVVFTVGVMLLYGFVVDCFWDYITPNYLMLGVLGFALSVVAQIGDLWASLIKRERGIKDYSNLLPGHGGFIDRCDSVFATATVVCTVCLIYPPFV